jgi:Spy/CpxP family protein refolding chaperone
MRTILTAVLLCGVLSLTTTVRAAEKAGGERAEKARERMQEVTEKLGLTEAQKEKLKPIFQAQGEKMKELMGNADLSREQKMEKMKALREEFAPKFKEILTPEQFEKWEKMREEMRGKLGDRAKQRRGGAEKK